MTNTRRLADPTRSSPRSQRQRATANAALDSPTSKRTTRATRTQNQSSELKAKVFEEENTPSLPDRNEEIEAGVTEAISPAQPEETTPKKLEHRKKVKQATEDSRDQEPQVDEVSPNAKRNPKVEEEDQELADPHINGDTPKTAKRKRTIKTERAEIGVGAPSPQKTKRKRATEAEIGVAAEDKVSPKQAGRKTKVEEEDDKAEEGADGQKKIKRRRKTKEEKEEEAMPLAARTEKLRMFIGAHVSSAKGRSLLIYRVELELSFQYKSRSPQFSHQLRSYWVNSLHVLQT